MSYLNSFRATPCRWSQYFLHFRNIKKKKININRMPPTTHEQGTTLKRRTIVRRTLWCFVSFCFYIINESCPFKLSHLYMFSNHISHSFDVLLYFGSWSAVATAKHPSPNADDRRPSKLKMMHGDDVVCVWRNFWRCSCASIELCALKWVIEYLYANTKLIKKNKQQKKQQ